MNEKAKNDLGIDFVKYMIQCRENMLFDVPKDSIRDLQTLKKILETGSAEQKSFRATVNVFPPLVGTGI